VKRGDIWTLAGGSDYAGKPRPALILQDDRFDATDSVTVGPFTSDPLTTEIMRLRVEPTGSNGLRVPSNLMIDKIVTVPKVRLGRRIGQIGGKDQARVNKAVIVFLGLTDVGDR
jgi:mRNA interferase MazF